MLTSTEYKIWLSPFKRVFVLIVLFATKQVWRPTVRNARRLFLSARADVTFSWNSSSEFNNTRPLQYQRYAIYLSVCCTFVRKDMYDRVSSLNRPYVGFEYNPKCVSANEKWQVSEWYFHRVGKFSTARQPTSSSLPFTRILFTFCQCKRKTMK